LVAISQIIRRIEVRFEISEPEFGEDGFSKRGSMRAQTILCMVGLSLALGAAGARAARAAPAGAIIQTTSHSGDAIHDLGALPPPPDSDTPTPTSPSAATVSSAQPVPELPIWAMLLLFFGGLGLAKLKRGRKDRLSPGIE
jgi:hypothetical protein